MSGDFRTNPGTSIRAVLSAIAGFAVVLLMIWGVNHQIVQPAFVELERVQALEDSTRARAAIQGELRQLDQKLGDWAAWDDAYAFAEDRNPAFVHSNLGDWRVLEKSTHVNLCLILDRQGERLYAGGYDSDLGGDLLPAVFSGTRPAIGALLHAALEREQARAGLLLTEYGVLLLATRPILTTQGKGPARGALVFGRFLDEPLRWALVEQTQVAFHLLAANDPSLTAAEREDLKTLRADEPELRADPAGAGFVSQVLVDLAGQPAVLLRTPIRQTISATAQQTSRTLAGVLALAALALLLGQAVWENRAQRSASEATAAAWRIATLTFVIGLTLTVGMGWELHRRSASTAQDFWLPLAIGATITLLLALYLFVLVARRQRAETLAATRTAELQAGEERYRIVALLTGQMIYDYDCLTGRIQWEGAIMTLTGHDPADFARVDIDAWAALIHPEDRPQALDRLRQAMAAGAPYMFDYRFARSDGAYCWVEDRGAFLLDERGTARRMLGTMKDVSERKQVAAALEAREAQLRTLIDAMPDIVCFKDGAGRWREANTFALRLFGLDRVAYRDKTDAELAAYSPLDRQTFQRFEDSDELAWQRGEPSRSDESLPQPDGSEKIFDVIRIPQFDDRRQRQSLLVVGRDISDRQYAEQQLRQSEEKFARIFQTTPNVVVISRVHDGVLLDVNPGFEEITGYSRAEAVGRSTLELKLWADPADRDRLVSDLRRYGEVLYRDFTFRRKDGAVRAGQYCARPLAIDHQSCLLFLMQDITERQQAEEALRQRDRLQQATADALALLLSGRDLRDTVGAALATLGQTVSADRSYIFENHIDPASGAPLLSQRYEWCADAATPQIDNPEMQNLSYDATLPGWYAVLRTGAAIAGLVRDLPEAQRALLAAQEIRSILLLPIQVDSDFWGLIGFDDCHTDRVWTQVEENILRTAAAAIGHAYVRLRAEAALRVSEEQHRTLVDNLNIGVYRNTGGAQGRFLQANPAVVQMFGYATDADFLQAQVSDLYADPQERLRFMTEILSHGQVTNRALHLRRKDGTTFWGAVTARVAYDDQGDVKWLDGVLEDVTARREAEARQRLAAAVFEATHDAILVTDGEGRIIAVNPAFSTLTGYPEAEVRGRSPRLLWSERQPEAYFEAIWQTVADEGVWQSEFWARRKDGERRATLANLSTVRDGAGQVTHYVGIATDITELKAAERRIEHLAHYDALTALPNRALLAQRAELALALAARRSETLAVLFLDLDRFKDVNDSLGHAAGDALLVQVAGRLQALLRLEDTVCRLGGDEFVLLLPEADQQGALRVADKVLAALREPFAVVSHRLGASVSVGIALYPHDGTSFADLLKNADTALYRAKQDGRNTRVFYDREMNAATLARLVLEAELRQAIAAGHLRAHYQPKVRLADATLTGAEALVRWQHPVRGLVPPAEFVPVAETSDLIVALGDWMLDEVCQQLATWRRQGLPMLTVAINLAARHFRQPGLADRIAAVLESHDLPARAIELELTESTLLEAGPDTATNLAQLQRLGVKLALDDFGTGYSSLSYLKRLPLAALKIDRSFVRDLVADPDDRAIAATIVALGHHLGLVVVAEGVETDEQRCILLEQGCDLAQGFLYDRPQPAEEFAAAWLNHTRA
jgi:diguanylate cyclase (GGDEF)-like protein/PAS domain S-box-containing protein